MSKCGVVIDVCVDSISAVHVQDALPPVNVYLYKGQRHGNEEGGGGVVGETVSFHQTFTLIGNRYHILYSTVDLCGHRGVHVP